MVDTRFYRVEERRPLSAWLVGIGAPPVADLRADHLPIDDATDLVTAHPGAIALAVSKDYLSDLQRTQAGAVVVSAALKDSVPAAAVAIVSERPHELFVDLLNALVPASTQAVNAGWGPSDAEPYLEENVTLGANVVLGTGVEIGRNTVIGPNSVVGPGVAIGRNCIIGANVTIVCAYLGNAVTVHTGARIGTEGFGWLGHGTTNIKVPQLGRAIVQDRCEIGPNATVDRGALGDTVIGEGTKLGNLVVIGHNSRLGRNCLLAPTTGLSGSTTLGDGVVMGAGAGTSGHMAVGDGSFVQAWAAVTKDWPPGSKLAGAPAQDIRDFWRELATVRRLSKGDNHR